MTLHEIRPGLRVLNKTNHVAKIHIEVPAGDELEVSEEVAGQIAAQTQDFVEASPDAYKRAVAYPPVEDEPEKPEPVKRAVKKRAGKS